MSQSTDALMERLERVERSNRRLKLLGFGVLAAIGTMGAAQGIPHTFDTLKAKQINAEAIFVVDQNGKLRIALGADPASDQGGVSVFQRNGIARAALGLDVGGNSGVTASDPDGALGVAAVSLANNQSLVSTFEPTGTSGAVLLTVPGAAGFNGVLVDQPDGTQRANILSSSGGSFMQLLSPSGLGALSMFEPADGKVPEFDIIDLNLTPRVTLAASDASTGNPFEVVRIRGANGIDRAEMDSGVSGPNGKVVTLDAFGAQTGILGGP